MKQAEIVNVLEKRMAGYKKGAAAANARLAAKGRSDPTNGFKAVINALTYRQLINVSMNTRNMTPKERAYVNAAMARRRQLM